jgi:hypothetical protein
MIKNSRNLKRHEGGSIIFMKRKSIEGIKEGDEKLIE